MNKEIIILAKSIKRGDFCIAGVDSTTGEWIRPVSENKLSEGSVPLSDITYSDGSELQVLDRVKINFLSHNPTHVQPENYVYNNEYYWQKTGRSTIDEVISFRRYDNSENLLSNNCKYITEKEIGNGGSLALVNVKNSYICIKTFEKKKIQLNFDYNGMHYKYFPISDPQIRKRYHDSRDGIYNRFSSLNLVMSLTEKYYIDNNYYKMIAQIF